MPAASLRSLLFRIPVLAAITCALGQPWASVGQAQPLQGFYVGHSLSDQIPDMVKSLSQDHPAVAFDWVYQSIPGAPLRWQWQRMAANDYTPTPPHFYGFYDAQHGLPTGQFDVLVLTESVPRYAAILDESFEYAAYFMEYALGFNPDTRVYLYEVWHCLDSGTPTGCDYDVPSAGWRQRLDDDLPMWESIVNHLNSTFPAAPTVCLIPGGQGLARLHDAIALGEVPGMTSIEEVFSDRIHLTDVGKYYLAAIHFAAIHGLSPEGLTHQLQVWWGGHFTAPTPAQAAVFQRLAWQTVSEYGLCQPAADLLFRDGFEGAGSSVR